MKALLRWLISITDMPQPRQSVSSSRACSRTSRGRVAGPAAKLNTRTTTLPGELHQGRHDLSNWAACASELLALSQELSSNPNAGARFTTGHARAACFKVAQRAPLEAIQPYA